MNNRVETIDITLPILPGKGLGGLTLKSSIQDLYGTLAQFVYEENAASLQGPFYVSYQINDCLVVVFNILNGKLVKIGALKNYQGSLFDQIRLGMTMKEVFHLQPNLKFDEDEEVYLVENLEGLNLYFENPYSSLEEAPDQKLIEITVYDPELIYISVDN